MLISNLENVESAPEGRLLLMVNSNDDALKQETVLRNEMLFRRLSNQETALRDEGAHHLLARSYMWL